MSLGITMWKYKLAEIPKTIFVEVKVNVIKSLQGLYYFIMG